MPNTNPPPNGELPADLLSRVHVAAPCPASWDAMPGGERVRSCEKCAHKVYNLSAMTSEEAAQLVARAEGKDAERVCVRFYRRSDGGVMTQDCPVGVRTLRQKAARRASVAFAAVGVVFGMNLHNKPRAEQPRLVRAVLNAIDPPLASSNPHSYLPAGKSLLDEGLNSSNMQVWPVMGRVALPMAPHNAPHSSFENGPEPAPPTPDKSFLNGAANGDLTQPNPNARPDPFAPHIITTGQLRVRAKTEETIKKEYPNP